MQKLSTKLIHFAYVFLFSTLFSSVSFSQIVIRDTVTIAPKNILLKPQSVTATSPVVDVSFMVAGDELDGSLIQIQMPDTTWIMYAAPCTGKAGALAADMGIFPEDGTYIGQLLYSDCAGENGTFTYSPYIKSRLRLIYSGQRKPAWDWIDNAICRIFHIRETAVADDSTPAREFLHKSGGSSGHSAYAGIFAPAR